MVYVLLYVVVTALSLPGAAVLTLAGGAIFGLGLGTLLVSFASSLGALLAFLVARTLLRDVVRRRFGRQLGPIEAGVKRDGVLYLLSLRLAPVFPFFLVTCSWLSRRCERRTSTSPVRSACCPARWCT